jgi:hypothetical protein
MSDDNIHFCRITARTNWGPGWSEGCGVSCVELQRRRIEEVLRKELGVGVYFDETCIWSIHCEGDCGCKYGVTTPEGEYAAREQATEARLLNLKRQLRTAAAS